MSALPPNATPLETAFLSAAREMLALDVPISALWTPQAIPLAALPSLAWALSADDWDNSWSVEQKRSVTAASPLIHARKGTIWAVRRMLEVMGYGDALIFEDWQLPRYGDPVVFGGAWQYGEAGSSWADYAVELLQPIRRADADRLVERLGSVAPACCRLRRISLAQGVAYAYGDALWEFGSDVTYGGDYNYEVTNG